MAREAGSRGKMAAHSDHVASVGVKSVSPEKGRCFSRRMWEGLGSAGPKILVQIDE